MIALLSHFFIKNRHEVKNPDVRRAYGMLTGCLGIFLNTLLFAFKLFAGSIAASVSVTADAFNNLSDAGSSIITLLGFKLASQKPDPNHPFGHGRLEYISGLIVAMIIVVMGFELFLSSIEKVIAPASTEFSWLGVGILIGSVCVKAYMAVYNHRTGKKIDSVAMRATALDSLTDCIATFTALFSMLASHYMELHIDGWCGVVVSLFVLYSGITAAKDTISPLLGQSPDKELVKDIQDAVTAHSGVIGVHDLIIHNYGPGRLMLSLHAEVPADGDVLELHDMIDNIERELRARYHCDAVIHMDPVVCDDAYTDALKLRVSQIIAQIDDVLQIHDFRVVTGPTHTNLIFDVAVPYKFRLSDAELASQINSAVSQMEGDKYFAVITIDKVYA